MEDQIFAFYAIAAPRGRRGIFMVRLLGGWEERVFLSPNGFFLRRKNKGKTFLDEPAATIHGPPQFFPVLELDHELKYQSIKNC